MRFLLDTMVVSEPAKPTPNASAVAWLDAQVTLDLAISVLSFGEIARGVARMNEGKRKQKLQEWLEAALPAQFEGRVLPVDLEVARVWGHLTAEGDRFGRPLHVIDGLLLATAGVHGLTVVTRNAHNFADRGIPVLNPYS